LRFINPVGDFAWLLTPLEGVALQEMGMVGDAVEE